jgi:hypothetical protein
MAVSWAARLAPEPFRDFLPYAAPSALKVVHAKQVLSRALDVTRSVADQATRLREAGRLQESLVAAGFGLDLQISPQPNLGLAPSELGEQERVLLGERVLTLYFHLLRWDGPLFLDLRPRHFGKIANRQQLAFYPSSLWCRPEPEFMERLRALYLGFYRNDRAALARGIELYRWQSSPSAGFEARIERLLRAHFGSADSSATRFSIAHFRATFDAIFEEVAASGAKLHPDLAFLGVELVGLYLTLESLNVPLDVRRVFDRAGI